MKTKPTRECFPRLAGKKISLIITCQTRGETDSEGANIDGVYSAVRSGKSREKYLMFFPFQKL